MRNTKGWPRIRRNLVATVVGGAAALAYGLVTLALFTAAGAEEAWRTFYGASGAFLIGAYVVSHVVNFTLQRQAKANGLNQPRFAMTFSLSGHDWQPMPQGQAELEWSKMHHLPAGGALHRAWVCQHCTVIRLECTDSEGGRVDLIGGVLPKGPWLHWVAGLFVRCAVEGPGASPARWRLSIFDRVECDWTALPSEKQATLRRRLGEPEHTSSGALFCPHCSAVRLDVIDSEGRDFLVVSNALSEPEPKWYAGILFSFGRVPTLASDAMDSPSSAPPRTSSDPLSRTQP